MWYSFHLQVPVQLQELFEEKCRKLMDQFRDLGLSRSRENLADNGETNTKL